MEKFDRLGCHVTGQIGYSCNVSSGVGKAFNEAKSYRISRRAHDDWDCGCNALSSSYRGRPVSYNCVARKRDEFVREGGQTIDLPFGPSSFNDEVFALDIAEVSHLLAKRSERSGIPWALVGRKRRRQKANTPDLRLLGPRHQRPRRCAAYSRDECTPVSPTMEH